MESVSNVDKLSANTSSVDSSIEKLTSNFKLQTVEGNYNQVNFSNNHITIYGLPLTQTQQGSIYWNLPPHNDKFTGRIDL